MKVDVIFIQAQKRWTSIHIFKYQLTINNQADKENVFIERLIFSSW